MQVCGSQCNYKLFLSHMHVALPLSQQNGSGKIQTIIRLLLSRVKSSEPSLPSLYVLCNPSDITATIPLHHMCNIEVQVPHLYYIFTLYISALDEDNISFPL